MISNEYFLFTTYKKYNTWNIDYRTLFGIADGKTAYISSFYHSIIPGENGKGNI